MLGWDQERDRMETLQPPHNAMHSALILSTLLFCQSAYVESCETGFISGQVHMYRAGSFASQIAASVRTESCKAKLNSLSLSSWASQATSAWKQRRRLWR